MPAPPAKKLRFDSGPNLEPEALSARALYTPTPQPTPNHPTTTEPTAPKRSAPTHGNYRGYYTKRSRAGDGDERLGLVPREWVAGKRVLDVGCNSGVVTVELAQSFGGREVIGVDIDEHLVGLAKRHTDLCWSRQAPLAHLTQAAVKLPVPGRDAPPHQKLSSIASASATADATAPPTLNYFPLALPRCYNYIPQPPRELMATPIDQTPKGSRAEPGEEVRRFPANVTFRTADWAKDGIEEDRKAYDIIFALSITKWVHLNTLNPGLLAFFTRLFRSLRPGGRLVLEPQPFATYKDSARLADALRANYEVLRDGDAERVKGWRDEEGEFERVLVGEVGFERRERLGETGEKGFHRPLDVYYKREGSWV